MGSNNGEFVGSLTKDQYVRLNKTGTGELGTNMLENRHVSPVKVKVGEDQRKKGRTQEEMSDNEDLCRFKR